MQALLAPMARAADEWRGLAEQYRTRLEDREARVAVLERGLARPGDRVLVTAGVPFDVPGTTNALRVEVI